ncbi:SCO family protein [Ilumatobacter nonamiensis]|uniref:SCO family protein n=1 Tax=Ilumatobacter nonamiensis TaxID=467093 RepID=UPI0011D28649|nr:SCO family protein [Ilumatobacter nonamiensis]
MNSPRPERPRHRRLHRIGGVALAAALVASAACGSDDESGGEASDPALSGVVRDPAPEVDLVTLPSLSDPGEEVEFRADEGELQVVYFGFTNCPDVCPTTMVDLAVALRMLDDDQADDVEVVMATVDPDRDLEILDGYVTSFVPDAIAVGTPDTELIAAAGEPFGASWEVRETDDGTIEVDHSPFLYAVDDEGKLVLSWQFGASSEDMAADISTLLERAQA